MFYMFKVDGVLLAMAYGVMVVLNLKIGSRD